MQNTFVRICVEVCSADVGALGGRTDVCNRSRRCGTDTCAPAQGETFSFVPLRQLMYKEVNARPRRGVDLILSHLERLADQVHCDAVC